MIQYIMDILSGRTEITDRFRYELARIGVSIVHLILLILFICIRCCPLAIFNLFSLLFYVVIAEILIKRQNYLSVFIGTYTEIVLHSFFACILVGWEFDFSLYNIGLIYVAYYFSYISGHMRNKILLPSILGLFNLTLTLTMYIYSHLAGPIYSGYSSTLTSGVSIMNICISAILIMTFATLHTTEIRRKEYELMSSNAKLNRLAHYDSLTQLRNRYGIEEALHALLDQTEDTYSFVMGDIDDFKKVNDHYGHTCGDYILKSVADVILKNMGAEHLACRWGGEEILMILRSDLDYSKIITEKIRYEIEHMNATYKGQTIHTTMSFGIAACHPGDVFEKCILLADQRLYEAKQNGKNRVICD